MRQGFLLAALLAIGCNNERPCRDDTLLVTVSFDPVASACDRFDVAVSVAQSPAPVVTLQHSPGTTKGTFEVDFPHGYPVGQSVTVSLKARLGYALLETTSASVSLSPTCTAWSIAFGAASDLGAPDGALDMNPPDLSGGPAPRPVAPLSTAQVTSQTPMLRWALASGQDAASVDVCSDHDCRNLVQHFDAKGGGAAVPAALPKGIYFWRVRGIAAGVPQGFGPTWQLRVGARSAAIDTSWGATFDVDEDGFSDLVVGAQCAPYDTANTSCGPGRAYFYKGSSNWTTTPPVSSMVLVEPSGADADYFGEAIGAAGDVNGDGYPDIVIGAYCAPSLNGQCGTGLVYVYQGGPTGLASMPTAALKRAAGAPGDFYGRAVASAGDVDSDGYSDVVIGAALANGTAGAAYVHRGGPSGLEINPTWTLPGPGGANGAFGVALAAGDFNGDGYSDLVVGAQQENSFAGAAYVYLGGPSHGFTVGQQPANGTRIAPPSATAGQNFGISVASAGDVNGDGYDDLIIGAPGPSASTSGRAYLYLGGAGGINAAQSPTVLSEATATATNGDFFGSSVTGDNDVDGDGYADLVVAADYLPFNTSTSTAGPGAAFFFSGFRLTIGAMNTPNLSVTRSGGMSGDRFGTTVRLLDVTGDGNADLFVGAIFAAAKAGAAAVFFGPALGTAQNLSAPDGANGNFGW